MPAWFSVALPTPASGTLGSTMATHTGELSFSPTANLVNNQAVVWADDAVLAVSSALTGTIQVSVGSTTTDYTFGPDTVGTTAGDNKAFLVTESSGSVSINFEDMAGQPGCDYDYNDRSWVSISASEQTGDVVIFEQSYLSPLMYDSQSVPYHDFSAKVSVTSMKSGDFRWNYGVTNLRFLQVDDDAGQSIDSFDVLFPGTVNVQEVTNSLGWIHNFSEEFGNDTVSVRWANYGYNDTLDPGESATFTFKTSCVPIVQGSIQLDDQIPYAVSLAAPGIAQADIDIVGKINGNEFTEETEDSIGGFVVKRAHENAAPRQEIVIQQLTAAGQPAKGGKVQFDYDNNVTIFDAQKNGFIVNSGKIYDNTQLPVRLWVQGSIPSKKMRDIKLFATPVGQVVGSDSISFSVAWVDITIRYAGKVSADNSASTAYINTTENSTGNLGLGRISLLNKESMSVGFEVKGVVSPSNLQYPGVTVNLDRDVNVKFFTNNVQSVNELPFSAVLPPGNDTSDPAGRDDSPPNIYDVDAPGIILENAPNNEIRRYRANFKSFAVIGGIRASQIKLSNARVSVQQIGGENKNGWVLNTDATADNGASDGHIELTAMLN